MNCTAAEPVRSFLDLSGSGKLKIVIDASNGMAGTMCPRVFGDKGFISRDLIDKFQLRDNPQIWSVGVKEVWQLAEGKDVEGQVWHTMGYPLVDGSFGGGFVYGMKGGKLTIGMVISTPISSPSKCTPPAACRDRS